VPEVPPTTIAWRGDAVSFIDVFDTDDISDVGGSNVVRVHYPNGRASTTAVAFNPGSLIAGIGFPTPGGSWHGNLTIRQYDQGECSVFLSWRDVLEQAYDAIEIALAVTGDLPFNVSYGLARTSLQPILHVNGQDEIVYFTQLDLELAGGGQLATLDATLRLRLVPGPGGLGLTVQIGPGSEVDLSSIFVNEFTLAFVGMTEAQVEDALLTTVSGEIATQLGSFVPAIAATIPIRVNVRADGLELVVAEDNQNVNYSLFNAAGICGCNPATPTAACRYGSTAAEAGALFAVFEPKFVGDPDVLGDIP